MPGEVLVHSLQPASIIVAAVRKDAKKVGVFYKWDVCLSLFYMGCLSVNVLYGMFVCQCFTWDVFMSMFYMGCLSVNVLYVMFVCQCFICDVCLQFFYMGCLLVKFFKIFFKNMFCICPVRHQVNIHQTCHGWVTLPAT